MLDNMEKRLNNWLLNCLNLVIIGGILLIIGYYMNPLPFDVDTIQLLPWTSVYNIASNLLFIFGAAGLGVGFCAGFLLTLVKAVVMVGLAGEKTVEAIEHVVKHEATDSKEVINTDVKNKS